MPVIVNGLELSHRLFLLLTSLVIVFCRVYGKIKYKNHEKKKLDFKKGAFMQSRNTTDI